MPESAVTLWDRPDIALSNLLAGDVGGAGRALVAPDTLAPDQRKKLLEKFGVSEQETGNLKYVMDVTTNPTVWLGAFLLAKYDPPGMEGYFNRLAKSEKEFAAFKPFLDKISAFPDIFDQTGLPAVFYEMGGRAHSFKNTGRDLLGKALTSYDEAVGGDLSAKALADIKVGLYNTQESGYLKPSLNAYVERASKAAKEGIITQKQFQDLQQAVKNLPSVSLNPAEQKLNAGLQSFYRWAYENTGPDVVQGMESAIERKAKKFAGDRLGSVAIGEELRDVYHPLFEVREHPMVRGLGLDDAVQKIYTQSFLEGGPAEYGLKLSGKSKMVLKPSEWTRLVRRFTETEAAEKNLIVGSPQFFEGLKGYIETFMAQQSGGATTKVASGTHLARSFGLIPDTGAIRKLGGQWENLANAIDSVDSKVTAEATALLNATGDVQTAGPMLARYISRQARIDAVGAATSYNEVRARDFAWSVVPEGGTLSAGEAWEREARMLRAKDPIRYAVLRDTYMPAAMGMPTYGEYKMSAMWDARRVEAARMLNEEGVLGKALKAVGGEGVRKNLETAIAGSPTFSWKGVNQSLSNYFFAATLGGNPLSAVKNLAQTVATTYPSYGLKHTLKGLSEATNRTSQYIENRLVHKMSHEVAFKESMGEFARTALSMDDSLMASIDATHDALLRAKGPTSKFVAKAQQYLMSMFATTEQFNRLTGYYAAESSAVESFAKKVAAGEAIPNPFAAEGFTKFATTNVAEALKSPTAQLLIRNAADIGTHATQFGAGVMNQPMALAGLPSTLRQFGQYPLRMVDFMRRLPLGGWGRLLAGAGALVGVGGLLLGETGKQAGVDASMLGALPDSNPDSPFFPMPLIPPALQLGGAAATSLVTGDPEQLQRALPLLVPGGVQAARIATNLSPTAGKLLGRSYVDPSKKGPDGRYPMYTADGALIGYFNATGLMLRSLGLPHPTVHQEIAMTNWMVKSGDRMAGYRKSYFEAMADNDQRAMDSISAEYEATYPGIGPIPIKKSQIQAYHMRKEVSRVERSLQQLPPEIRDQFWKTAATAFGQSGPGFLGVTQEGMQISGTARARDPYRIRPMTQIGAHPYGGEASDLMGAGQHLADRFATGSSLGM